MASCYVAGACRSRAVDCDYGIGMNWWVFEVQGRGWGWV